MKKSIIVMMATALIFSLNLFGETGAKGCKHDEMMKNCTKEMMHENKCDHEGEPCTEECKTKVKMKCDHPKDEACTEECKHETMMKDHDCKPDCTMPCCVEKNAQKCDHKDGEACTDKCKHEEVKMSCKPKAEEKSCHKK